MNNRRLCLTSFHLKLLAIILMTIDHLGALVLSYIDGLETLTYITRVIGRLSLPLFAFLIVEGVKHTSNNFKYVLRLSICAAILSVTLLLMNMKYSDNIFIDLALGAALLSCLKLDKYKKLYSLIPLGIIVTLCLLPVFISSYPKCLTINYNFYSIVMMGGFYLVNIIKDKYHKLLSIKVGMEQDVFEEVLPKQKLSNILNMVFLIIFNLICWIINYLSNNQISTIVGTMSIQIYAMFAGFIILFYSGKKGYSALWWKYGCYLYYPIHIAILYMVYLLI